jgi:hypothetical protein
MSEQGRRCGVGLTHANRHLLKALGWSDELMRAVEEGAIAQRTTVALKSVHVPI